MRTPTRRASPSEAFASLPDGEEAMGTGGVGTDWAGLVKSAASAPARKLTPLSQEESRSSSVRAGATHEGITSPGSSDSDDGAGVRGFSTPPHLRSSRIPTGAGLVKSRESSPSRKLPQAQSEQEYVSSSIHDGPNDEGTSSLGSADSDNGAGARAFSIPARKIRPLLSSTAVSVGSDVEFEVSSSESADSEDGTMLRPRAPAYLGCYQEAAAGSSLCNKCTGCLKIGLKEARTCSSLGTGSFCYCLQCRALIQGEHGRHKSDSVPLDVFDGSQVAWVTKKERWSSMFAGIQSDRHWNRITGRPFLLHTPQGHRCEECADHLSDDNLYGTLILFCTVQCWAENAGAAAEYEWVGALVNADFDGPGAPCDAFCCTCQRVFRMAEDGAEHQLEHQVLGIRTGFEGGTAATKVEISSHHFMARPWKCIKDLAGGETMSSEKRLFRLRDEGAQRCRCCKIRLEDGGGYTCSLECALPDPIMLPRPLRTQVKPLGESQVQRR